MSAPTRDVYPLLLADIGGTRIRLALKPSADTPLQCPFVLATADYRELGDAVAAWIGQTSVDAQVDASTPIASAAIALAAPLQAGPIRLTNTDFTIDREALRQRFRLAAVRLMNDFEALAWSLPTLGPADARVLGRADEAASEPGNAHASSASSAITGGAAALLPAGDATMAVLGAGTGIGCAGLARTARGWMPLPGEGGHVTLSAQTDLEAAVIERARREFGHVSAERLLAGPGLPRLYRYLAEVRNQPYDAALRRGEDLAAAAATEPLALETIYLWGALLGGYAGNVALVLGARGGVWLAGGIAPLLADQLAASPFRERFEQKGRFVDYLRSIGTAIITRPHPAFDGLTYAVAHSAEHGTTP